MFYFHSQEVARKYLGESGVIFFAVAVAVSALGTKLLVVLLCVFIESDC